jgi:hypothetical protein
MAANVIVGVNVVGVQNLSETQQTALVELLQKEGGRTVRTGFGDMRPSAMRRPSLSRLPTEVCIGKGCADDFVIELYLDQRT